MKYFYLLLTFYFSFTSNSQNTITIEKKIFFDYNQFNLSAKSVTSLDSLVNVCNKYSNYSITIIGYTDSSGSTKYNQKLSTQRSKTVFDYLTEKNLNASSISHQGFGVDNKTNNEAIQRNTTVTFSAKAEDCYYKTNTLNGVQGTQVSMNIKEQSNAEFSLSEYFSTQNMLESEKFALDMNGDVLETAGMIDIDLKNIDPNAIEDGKIQIEIPTLPNQSYDNEMSIWVEKMDKNGNKRWENLKIKPKWDAEKKRYLLDMNASYFSRNRISINLDKQIYRDQLKSITTGKDKKVIIVATENDEFFYNVSLSSNAEGENNLKFSAKIDKTGFAFVIPKKVNPKNLTFTGTNSSGNKSFNLSNCKISKYKNKYLLYKYFPKSTSKQNSSESIKKKGFWDWLKRIFS
jgi:hypothetical protein